MSELDECATILEARDNLGDLDGDLIVGVDGSLD